MWVLSLKNIFARSKENGKTPNWHNFILKVKTTKHPTIEGNGLAAFELIHFRDVMCDSDLLWFNSYTTQIN